MKFKNLLVIVLVVSIVLLGTGNFIFAASKVPYCQFILSSTHVCYVEKMTGGNTPETKTIGNTIAFVYTDKRTIQISTYDVICAYSEQEYHDILKVLQDNKWLIMDINNYSFVQY